MHLEKLPFLHPWNMNVNPSTSSLSAFFCLTRKILQFVHALQHPFPVDLDTMLPDKKVEGRAKAMVL